jgi:hypothetical protein
MGKRELRLELCRRALTGEEKGNVRMADEFRNLIAYSRDTNWDYERRWKDGAASVGGLEFEDELAGSNGAHFHIWLPKSNPDTEAEQLQTSLEALRNARDVVNWSWDYVPEPASLEAGQYTHDDTPGGL